jgi:hypothetical protein
MPTQVWTLAASIGWTVIVAVILLRKIAETPPVSTGAHGRDLFLEGAKAACRSWPDTYSPAGNSAPAAAGSA